MPGLAPSGAEIAATEGAPGQWLFRAEISGEAGSGSLRLLLRRFDAERFTLAAADALGQARWEIRRDHERGLWIDPQAQLFCRLDPRLPLRAKLAVPSVPLADFAGLLTGEWPPADLVVQLPAATATPERPFTAEPADRHRPGASEERRGGDWASWTLWESGEPVAWFKRLDSESLLSVRRPSVQVRWRVTAQGMLPQPAGESVDTRELSAASVGDVPAGVQEMACPDNAIP